MHQIRRTLSITVFLLVAFSCYCQTKKSSFFFTGNTFMEWYASTEKMMHGSRLSDDDVKNLGMLQGYVYAAFDMTYLSGHPFKLTETTSLLQMSTIIANYLRAHPSEMSSPLIGLVIKALSEFLGVY